MLKASLISLTGLSTIGFPVIFSYSYGQLEKASIPKLVLSSQEASGTQLSWDYKSFSQDGVLKENEQVSFEKSNMKFGDYKLKKGDILCSPDQDGTYLVLKKKAGRNYEYEIEGEGNKVYQICPNRGFLKSHPNVKTIKLSGFKAGDNFSISTIFISSCFFELNKSKTNSKLEIIWDKCKSTEFNGTTF